MRRDPWCGPGDGINSMPLSCYKEQFVVCFLQGINYGSSAHKTQKFGGRTKWNVRSYMRIFVFELTKCPTVTLLTSRRELLVFCWHTFLNSKASRVRIRRFRKDTLVFVRFGGALLRKAVTNYDIRQRESRRGCGYFCRIDFHGWIGVFLSHFDGIWNSERHSSFPPFLQLPRQPMTNRARKSPVTSPPKRLINRLNPVMHPTHSFRWLGNSHGNNPIRRANDNTRVKYGILNHCSLHFFSIFLPNATYQWYTARRLMPSTNTSNDSPLLYLRAKTALRWLMFLNCKLRL